MRLSTIPQPLCPHDETTHHNTDTFASRTCTSACDAFETDGRNGCFLRGRKFCRDFKRTVRRVSDESFSSVAAIYGLLRPLRHCDEFRGTAGTSVALWKLCLTRQRHRHDKPDTFTCREVIHQHLYCHNRQLAAVGSGILLPTSCFCRFSTLHSV